VGSYVLVTSGTGATVCEAQYNAYDVLDELRLPNSPGWRTDIGCRLDEQLPELHKMGYAEDIHYD
jgi:phosphoribosylamine-glycine ligase